jgi:hypothetical protein
VNRLLFGGFYAFIKPSKNINIKLNNTVYCYVCGFFSKGILDWSSMCVYSSELIYD